MMKEKNKHVLANEWWQNISQEEADNAMREAGYYGHEGVNTDEVVEMWISNGSPMIKEEQVQSLTIQTDGLLNYSKKDIQSKISHAKQLVEGGVVDKTQAYIYAKKLESLGKDLASELKPLADDQTIQKGGITLFNATITQGEQGVKWDYSVTHDAEWLELDAQMKELKAKKDVREKFLQGITKPLEVVNTDTGETYTIHPPVKSGTLGLSVKII